MSQTYTIRPLEWDWNPTDIEYQAGWDGVCECAIDQSGGRFFWRFNADGANGVCDSLDAAKLAAEAHWQERIKQALVPVEVKQHDGSGQ